MIVNVFLASSNASESKLVDKKIDTPSIFLSTRKINFSRHFTSSVFSGGFLHLFKTS